MPLSIVAALVGAGVSAAIGGITAGHRRRKDMAFTAEDKIREYNEMVRQQHESSELYRQSISTTLGADFYSALTSGATSSQLISSIGSETSLGRTLALEGQRADKTMVGAKRQTDEMYQLARMASQQALTEGLGLHSQMAVATGEAVAAQATSGIRADKGTGGNLAEIQAQQNDIAQRMYQESTQNQIRQTIMKMDSAQLSASEQADLIRKQRDLQAESAIEQATVAYAEFIYNMKDYDESQRNLQKEVEHLRREAGRQANKIEETYDKDLINASQFKFIDD